jgi:hypothetical protein
MLNLWEVLREAYIIKLVDAHWVEMEKKGLLPKGK